MDNNVYSNQHNEETKQSIRYGNIKTVTISKSINYYLSDLVHELHGNIGLTTPIYGSREFMIFSNFLRRRG